MSPHPHEKSTPRCSKGCLNLRHTLSMLSTLQCNTHQPRIHDSEKSQGLKEVCLCLLTLKRLSLRTLLRGRILGQAVVNEKGDICKQHLLVLLNCHRAEQPAVHAWVLQQRRDTSQDLPSDKVPTLQKVASAVSALKNHKAAGVCGISPEIVSMVAKMASEYCMCLLLMSGTKASCQMTGELHSLCLYTRKVIQPISI